MMKTNREELKLQEMAHGHDAQRVDESLIVKSNRRWVGLEHAERGQFIPFAEAIKKLG